MCPRGSCSENHPVGKGWVMDTWGVETSRELHLWTWGYEGSDLPPCVGSPVWMDREPFGVAQSWGLVPLSPLPSLRFKAHHRGSGRLCSRTVLSEVGCEERNTVRERNGEGGKKETGSCSLSSQVTVLSHSQKTKLSLTPSLV